MEEEFIAACANGDINSAKLILQKCPKMSSYALREACKKGNLNVVQWLVSLKNNKKIQKINRFINTFIKHEVLFISCSCGKLEVVKWFVFNNLHNNNINTVFIWACEKDQLQIAQWLLQFDPTIDISANNEYSFRTACEYGYLRIAQLLLQIKPTINISANNESAFRKACYKGHLHVSQWLLQVKPTIDISFDNELVFRMVCLNGHLQVAQWLLEIKPTINISVGNDFAFKSACYNGCLRVAKWLQAFMPFKYFINNNEVQTRYSPYIHPNNKSAALAIITFFKKKGYMQYLTAALVCKLFIR